jgi:hypothetical protein
MPFISSAHRAPLQADLTTDRRLKRIAKQRKEAALALKAERAAIALQEEETALHAEREREHIGKNSNLARAASLSIGSRA